MLRTDKRVSLLKRLQTNVFFARSIMNSAEDIKEFFKFMQGDSFKTCNVIDDPLTGNLTRKIVFWAPSDFISTSFSIDESLRLIAGPDWSHVEDAVADHAGDGVLLLVGEASNAGSDTG